MINYLLIISLGAFSVAAYFLLNRSKSINRSKFILQQVFNHSIPICLTNNKYEIIAGNDAYRYFWGETDIQNRPMKCYESRPGESCHTENCPIAQISRGAAEYAYEPQKELNGKTYHFVVTAKPLFDENSELIGIIEYFFDVTERKRAEQIRTNLIEELEESLQEANLLSGFLPICASCKRIRNDQGFWDKIEKYITEHSQAKFSHGICPDCAQKLYPDLYKEIKEK